MISRARHGQELEPSVVGFPLALNPQFVVIRIHDIEIAVDNGAVTQGDIDQFPCSCINGVRLLPGAPLHKSNDPKIVSQFVPILLANRALRERLPVQDSNVNGGVNSECECSNL